MTTEIVWEGRHGDVVIRRTLDDGTVVLLACEELDEDAEPTGTIVSPQGGGRGDGGSAFPLALRKVSPRPLALDVSALPQGMLRFDADAFARRAIEALEAGVHEVALDLAHAEAWGYRGALPL